MDVNHRIEVRDVFSAAHHLRGVEGPCARNHGHNWRIRVAVEAEALDSNGMVVDILALASRLRTILDQWEHRDLNEIPPFDAERNPTAENVALTIAEALRDDLPRPAGDAPLRLVEVRVGEIDSATAVCRIQVP